MCDPSFAKYLTKIGIEQGERKSMLEATLEVLEIRFGLSETHALSDHIATIDDLQRLKQLHRTAIQVSSLAVFLEELNT